ncbi:MAG: indole-3-glycerol phosphate synthase TrpC [Atopobiaceae bacterium]|jgi:indole-3-glycerol phosphate synthase|nr:indole-3-glycerol phosphate synthase TrpC [Atopobiaceae bacterium]MCH4179812.1 indole-3-glycerol phosphate synthase TrpC [Atopobiaceae bacterium]MCH4213563.1 indole-3-glycerol phosphate synthase TrpC [Atopobiaceae bacterium]MCH4230050.1 indole-3-glycerol phosphate synthase TrpC [Atopobiaceae bacterium]MCH4276211.1 indole-3-glycerol phosphate synthase TrpC [Atopobiaceae bacterium]
MILDELADTARGRVAAARERVPESELRAEVLAFPRRPLGFAAALAKPGLSLICEVKKASPSKGVIDPDFDYRAIAADYEAAGADAVSCLTEPSRFLGSDDVFRAVRGQVTCPMLRKDFTVDAYQLYEARLMGADAVLLICAILDDAELAHGLALADELGLDTLVEAHDEAEVERALAAGARIIGVNNRDLRDFTVDPHRAERFRRLVPDDVLFVAESGVGAAADLEGLVSQGVDAALVGEFLMRSDDRAATMARMREAAAR